MHNKVKSKSCMNAKSISHFKLTTLRPWHYNLSIFLHSDYCKTNCCVHRHTSTHTHTRTLVHISLSAKNYLSGKCEWWCMMIIIPQHHICIICYSKPSPPIFLSHKSNPIHRPSLSLALISKAEWGVGGGRGGGEGGGGRGWSWLAFPHPPYDLRWPRPR